MKPAGLKTKIFLDSGDPNETKRILSLLGFLDGQTTNPTLIAKNPAAQARFNRGERYSETEIYDFYRNVVNEIATLVPDGSISIEVYANKLTTTEKMLDQSIKFYSWIPNAHIKFPLTPNGMQAGHEAIKRGYKINMTLCFTQAQAACVYAATLGAHVNDVYISPFVGRLDDIGENGMDLIQNIIRMYKESDHHVQVLAASVRTLDHFMYSLALGTDIVTAPFAVLKQWAESGTSLPDAHFAYMRPELKPIEYKPIALSKPWQSFDISHSLTDKGVDRFAADWNALLS